MNTLHGNKLTISIFGESHGKGVGAALDGFPAGIPLDFEKINYLLSLRKPKGGATTQRKETDEYEILSGVTNGKTNGYPLCVFFRNNDVKEDVYTTSIPRPSHADLPAYIKYGGNADLSGGGHFSARLTAPLVFIGAMCEGELKKKGIETACAISSIGKIHSGSFYDADISDTLFSRLDCDFPIIDESKIDELQAYLNSVRDDKNSVGGCVEVCIKNLPAGIGEPFFDSIESRLASLAFSIPAVKGVEFGKGFSLSEMTGDTAADEYNAEEVKKLLSGDRTAKVAYSNSNGGITGGLTNAMPLIMRVAFKPIPSIGKPLRSVDMETLKEKVICTEGRHDACAAIRGAVVVRAVAAIGVYDLI